MNKFQRDRRDFLIRLGSTTLSLPFLELMRDVAPVQAQSLNRPIYVIIFAGMSTGGNGGNALALSGEGHDFSLNRATRPLSGGTVDGQSYSGVKNDVTLLTGLEIPWADGSQMPKLGRQRNWQHTSTLCALLSGTTPNPNSSEVRGPSSDILMADLIHPGKQPLMLRVQPQEYRGGGALNRTISYRRDGDQIRGIDPLSSPQALWTNLFGQFVPNQGDDQKAWERSRRREQYVVTLLQQSTAHLRQRLGREDSLRLERFYSEVHDLEQRLAQVDVAQGMCMPPAKPGADPQAKIDSRTNDQGELVNFGWSNEELRARLMFDMLHMALLCGKVQVASMMMTYAQCFMSAEHITAGQVKKDLHQVGHGAGRVEEVSDCYAWHLKHVARFIDKCKASDLLQRMGLVFVTEGGFGHDPQTQKDSSPHSSQQMTVMVAGGAGGLKPQGHLNVHRETPSIRVHPAEITHTVMKAVHPQAKLGEVSRDMFPMLKT